MDFSESTGVGRLFIGESSDFFSSESNGKGGNCYTVRRSWLWRRFFKNCGELLYPISARG